jgi:hypothetical protein
MNYICITSNIFSIATNQIIFSLTLINIGNYLSYRRKEQNTIKEQYREYRMSFEITHVYNPHDELFLVS